MLVVTLGDLLLDVIVRLREPLATGADAEAATLAAPGGQAANVAAWVAALGGQARCVARRGDDAAGVVLAAELHVRRVELVGPAAGTNGGVVSIVVRGGVTERCQARDTSVVDTTGAGDALAAGFLVGGPELALEAAARCVAQPGAMP